MAEEPRARWMMGGITSEEVESYLYALAPPRDAVLAEMEQAAAERKIPIVGPLVGRFFHQLAGALGLLILIPAMLWPLAQRRWGGEH